MIDQHIAFIFVLYHTPHSERVRLERELKKLHLKNYSVYWIDNTKYKKGYAYGVNKGIRKALQKEVDLVCIANPDISFRKVRASLYDGLNHFDILGYAMEQDNVRYYGGQIDAWRMSGGLIIRRPRRRFSPVEFVSGSCMVIKREVIERIGCFDESYGMYYEDVDYCYRAIKSGYKVGIDRDIVYEHFEVSKKNIQKGSQLRKSRLRFFMKYSTIQQKIYEFIRIPKTIKEAYEHLS
jgi:GT2 family glycosyltransferase